jgi:competence protein ComEC
MNGLPTSIRAVPALVLALCFAGGVVMSSLAVPFAIPVAVASTALCIRFTVALRSRGRIVTLVPLATVAAIAGATLLTGYLRHEVAHRPEVDDIRRWLRDESIEVLLSGRVVSEPVRRGDRVRFQIDVREIRVAGRPYGASGRALIVRDLEEAGDIYTGLSLEIGGNLAVPHRARNPADFDYQAFLARQGVYSILTSRSADPIRLDASSISPVDRLLRSVRLHIRRTIDSHVASDESRSIVRALTLGDRSGLSNADRERFARSGLMHLLAVSGLHVLLVGMVFYRLLRPTLVRLKLRWTTIEVLRSGATIGLLLLYMMVTGNSPSVVRAVVMTSVFIFGTVLQRRTHPLNTLGIAALVLLAARPSDLFQAGFQLSFSAVSAIVLFSPAIPTRTTAARLHPFLRYAGQSAGVSLAATVGTMPVLLYHFGRTSFAGLALNLAAIPTTAALLSSSLLMLITAPISVVAAIFGSASDALAQILISLAGTGDTWFEWALVDMYVRDAWWLVALGGVVAIPSVWSIKPVRWKYLAVLGGFTLMGSWSQALSSRTGHLDILFFDVGQADAVLLKFPNGRSMLVDAGRRDFGFDAGERVILPHMRRFGLSRLDAIVITHPHNDHIGGLPHLLHHSMVRRVIDNGDAYDSGVFRETIHLIDRLALERRGVRSGDTLLVDPRVRILVLAPDARSGTGTNDRSVVLMVAFGKTRILLTGDAEQQAEGVLVHAFPELLQSDLVKAGHHGSSTSSTQEFVNLVTPPEVRSHAVVSVGAVNRYRHPSMEVVSRWRAQGAELHKTSLEGALWFRTDGKSVKSISWRR